MRLAAIFSPQGADRMDWKRDACFLSQVNRSIIRQAGVSPSIQQNRRRGKAKAKAKASKIGYAGDGKSSKSHKLFEKCAAQFIGTRTYGGSCEKSFAATIGCENEESLKSCFYQEESFDGSTSLDVCYPFDMAEALSIDGNTCMLGFANGGILLKNSADTLDPSCEPKYVLKMTSEIGKESSDELLLYFSSDGGESFYNEDDPRVATRASEDEIHSRRAEVCIASSSCGADAEPCNYSIESVSCLPFGSGSGCCSNCCSRKSERAILRYGFCTCIPSGQRCGYENEASLTEKGLDSGCVKLSQEWDFPAYKIGNTPFGEGKYDKCCSGVSFHSIQPQFLAPLPHTAAFGQIIVLDKVIQYSDWWNNRSVAYKCA
ncbi:hypothetical protein THAOC_29988 [Thalassiosira oceanica]|uniref:Uncharacterized protein n=1 Tax=Thalassiosira oceanica TaxID=159749 RepID=K0RF57_THAOC|nr:hypothetical protein THAOC_29988 [Thalassiosira oceanica]|eukprot:EJK50899.1 hypothetical protein THAOC_29988 [Thalassiosira oceanica]